MTELKAVKSRLMFHQVFINGKPTLDITSTYNMTKRDFMDRNPDMEVETAEGERMLINKTLIIAIREIKVVAQEVEEVQETEKNAAKPGAKYKEVIH